LSIRAIAEPRLQAAQGQRCCADLERETPAGVRAKPGSPARSRRVQSPAASLKPGGVNRAFRRQAPISTDRKKPRPDRRWSGLQERKLVQSTPTAQIGNSPHYPWRWSSGSLAMLARSAGFVASEEVRRRAASRLLLEIDVGEPPARCRRGR
jgi:hypothetical protein